MAQDSATPTAVPECEVMASVDSDTDGERLIIAELCREEAYLAVPVEAAVDVHDWR